MQINFTEAPSSELINTLTDRINEETPSYGAVLPWAFSIQEEGELVAGCNGYYLFGVLYTDQLWVAESHRKQGLGRKLMEAVHAMGRKKGYKLATVHTMDFQGAIPFYQKIGYTIDFTRPGYTQGAHFLALSKKL